VNELLDLLHLQLLQSLFDEGQHFL
jgi:hypothetical protein